MLLCISNNNVVEELINRIHKRAMSNSKTENFIIIQMHNANTKINVIHHRTKFEIKFEKCEKNLVKQIKKRK